VHRSSRDSTAIFISVRPWCTLHFRPVLLVSLSKVSISLNLMPNIGWFFVFILGAHFWGAYLIFNIARGRSPPATTLTPSLARCLWSYGVTAWRQTACRTRQFIRYRYYVCLHYSCMCSISCCRVSSYKDISFETLWCKMKKTKPRDVQLFTTPFSTLCPKKRSHFYFLNNSVKNEPILSIYGTLNPEGTWH